MEQLLKNTTAYKIFLGDRRGNKLSHAYMLVFPDSANMRRALKFFAAEFFGAEKGSVLHERIYNGSYSDFKLIPPEGEKPTADGVTEIIADSALKPVEGDKKLYAFSDFEAASALIQNKLLKTLEEPPAGAHFLLGATSDASVLDTVKSRVKTLTVPPFTEEQIFAALERKCSRAENRAAAESCGGVLGVAENMAAGNWFGEIRAAAEEICSATKLQEIGEISVKYGAVAKKKELLCEMQRIYFSALKTETRLHTAAATYALEELTGAFADLKFNANFQNLLYNFLLKVVKENEKWQRLQG